MNLNEARRVAPNHLGDREIYLLIALWAAVVGVGVTMLWQYQLTPGAAPTAAPEVWPADRALPSHQGRALLLMVAHPQCICTRASLNELDRLIARFEGLERQPALFLSVIVPKGAGKDWTDGPVVRKAATIRGLKVVLDPEGRFAKKFGATTSGHTLLYGADGTLLFSGGITSARGHEGDATGQAAILASLYGKQPGAKDTSVFGCGLKTPSGSI